MVFPNLTCGSFVVQDWCDTNLLESQSMIGRGTALGGWLRPKVVRFEHLLDAEDEQAVRRLRSKGHELHWALEKQRRQLQRDGWKRVTQWDNTGRLSIFMDDREEIILLHRTPAKTLEAAAQTLKPTAP